MKYKAGITVMQHLRAENDTNGNPRRLYIFYNWDEVARDHVAATIAVYEEGYHGMPKIGRYMVELPSVNITNSEYRETKKDAKLRNIYHY